MTTTTTTLTNRDAALTHDVLSFRDGVPVRRGDVLDVQPWIGAHTADPRTLYRVRVIGTPSAARDEGGRYEKRHHAACMAGPNAVESFHDSCPWTWENQQEAGVLTRQVRVEIVGRLALDRPDYGLIPVAYDW